MKMKVALHIIQLLLAYSAHAAVTTGDAAATYLREKEKVVTVDQQSREVMGSLYIINQRMRTMSHRRDILNNKIIVADANVHALAKDTANLEKLIKEQRVKLSKRLKAIYMLGDEGVVRIIFSSASAQDLDQSLKYLKLISDHDYTLIKSHEKNLKLLTNKKEKLRIEVTRLIALKSKMKYQEQLLSDNQNSKSTILEKLREQRTKAISRLPSLRAMAKNQNENEIFDISFYEQRGRLILPAVGQLKQGFGMTENSEFQYRLSHKGLRFNTAVGSGIQSIYSGRIAFVGNIEGYGKTIVVDHGDHYYSVYSKVQESAVHEGQAVPASFQIAKSSEEFYFEIRHFSDAIDPKYWLREI